MGYDVIRRQDLLDIKIEDVEKAQKIGSQFLVAASTFHKVKHWAPEAIVHWDHSIAPCEILILVRGEFTGIASDPPSNALKTRTKTDTISLVPKAPTAEMLLKDRERKKSKTSTEKMIAKGFHKHEGHVNWHAAERKHRKVTRSKEV